jgi:hypothetical protein
MRRSLVGGLARVKPAVVFARRERGLFSRPA